MIQHGMGAYSKSNGGDGLVENFDVQGAWKQSLESYVVLFAVVGLLIAVCADWGQCLELIAF